MTTSLTADERGTPAVTSESTSDAFEAPDEGSRRLKSWTHKPAIDGLRGIAVLAVLLYHGKASWARGGFLGVDLFFALSGYLITALLLVERQEKGRVDAKAFWIRRAKRLLPALFLMMLAVAVYVALFAGSEEAGRLRSDGLATMFYGGNWWYALSGASYFENFQPSMFRHTWSLGIEEQFYLVWPLVFIFGYRWFKGRVDLLAYVVAGLAVLSAALMFLLYVPENDPSRVFYGTDTRAQALLLGAALALIMHGQVKRVLPPRVLEIAGLVAFGVFASFFVLASDQQGWMYQGGFLLVAIASVVMIAAAAGPQDTIMNQALSIRPLRWVGMISYGLYLWHWPIFVFLNEERTGLSGYPLLGVRLLVTFAVAVASYYLIEMPVRRSDYSSRSLTLTLVGATLVMVVLFFGATTMIGGATDPILANRSTDPNARRILVNGDSAAFRLAYYYSGFGALNVDTAAQLGCGVVRGQNQPVARPPLGAGTCDNWPQKWQTAEKNFKPNLTVVGIGAWEVYDKKVDGNVYHVGTPDWRTYVRSELEYALKLGTPNGGPIVFLNVPCYRDTNSVGAAPDPERNDPDRIDALNRALTEFAAAHKAQVHLLDLKSFLCPGGKYADEIEGAKIRDDGIHYTKEGAAVVWRWLVPQLDPILGNQAPAAPGAPGAPKK